MDNSIEEVKKRIDIVDFIGSRIALQKAGRNFKANCPFHSEKTPSFVISPERQIWHCFGACQDGGDVIKFLMRYENITFFEALKELAEKVGVKLARVDFEDQAWKSRERLFGLNSLAADFYHYLLEKHRVGEQARQYLKKRDVTEKLIVTFSLGYAPASWDSLIKFLTKKKYSLEEIVTAGLAIKSDRGKHYDRFRGRIMFPIKDARKNIVGFSGRVLDGEKQAPSTVRQGSLQAGSGQAKYVNTPETPIYHKRETLYGIDVAKEAIKSENNAVVVEGEFDMISLFAGGVGNVVAVKGSAVTRDQLQLLGRLTKRLTLALDADFSGNETTKRAIGDAELLDFDIMVAPFEKGKDPDEAIKTDPIAFKEALKKPLPIYDFVIKTAIAKHENLDAFGKKEVGEEIIPFLSRIENPIVKSHYVKKVADLLGVESKSIETSILKFQRKEKFKKTSSFVVKPIEKSRYEMLQQYILSLVVQDKNPAQITEKMMEIIAIDDFSVLSYQKIMKLLIEVEKSDEFDFESFVKTLPPEMQHVCDELFLFDIAIFDKSVEKEQLDRVLYEFRRLSLKKRIKEGMVKMDSDAKPEDVTKLTSELSAIEKKLLIL